MEAPRRLSIRQQKRSKWVCWTLGAVSLVLLIVIIVPTAVILSHKNERVPHGLPATAMVPLYSYPTGDAWRPLSKAINTTTGPRWVVIINPDSGPGNCSTPNSDFVAGIKQLNSYPNVQTIGYVRTGYGGRNTSEILRDIDTYSGWSYSSPDLSMHGIFFDEAVYEYSPDAAETLQIIDYHAKNASGIAGSRLVIHNPGVLPDPRLDLNTTDATVVFEGSLKDFHRLNPSVHSVALPRSSKAYVVHSAGGAGLRKLVAKLSYGAGYLFVTDRKEGDPYGRISSDFLQSFAEAIPTWRIG